ncbi:mitogen-activated kinase kinase kinase 18-like [Olea europaea subsp. europaea]|uniref:Mitogen-activated kinase kinase kinase 18-like n=1 Tax=Olea europaea subsp. europaea TaxID=158383 RepID=A0A8S0SJ13_OLEEU|nr:mitogen-activated kinase kinase kinase 18-like [Olea europaea subsp. europaea]
MGFWSKVRILGAGSYGTVHLAAKVDPPLSVSTAAVKSATFPYSNWLKKEGEILFELRGCREIVQCFGEDTSIENNRGVYNLLLEYASGGSLVDLIKNYGGNMPESMVACYSYMLLKGLSHVHEKWFIHCDMKPANVLVFPSEDESIALGIHEPVTDIWSLGCIVVEMITGRRIWSTARNDGELFQQIGFGNPIPENISDIANDFLNKCLAKKHEQTWTADMLLNHPFIVKNLAALPPDFNDRVLLSQTNPFGNGIWASTNHLFTAPPKLQIPYLHQLRAPPSPLLLEIASVTQTPIGRYPFPGADGTKFSRGLTTHSIYYSDTLATNRMDPPSNENVKAAASLPIMSLECMLQPHSNSEDEDSEEELFHRLADDVTAGESILSVPVVSSTLYVNKRRHLDSVVVVILLLET